MPHRVPGLITWLVEALKALVAVLATLFTVETFGPHLGAVLITIGEMTAAWIALPKPEKVGGQFNATERVAYRDARRLLFRKRRRRLALFATALVVLIITSNVLPGARGLDTLFSTIYVGAVAFQTLTTLQRADEVFNDPANAVRRLFRPLRPLGRSRTDAAGNGGPANGATSEQHRGKTHVGS